MRSKLFLTTFLLFFTVNNSFTQIYRGREANRFIQNTELIKFKSYSKVPNYFRFAENSAHSEQETIKIIKSFIKTGNSDLQVKKVQMEKRYMKHVNKPIQILILFQVLMKFYRIGSKTFNQSGFVELHQLPNG